MLAAELLLSIAIGEIKCLSQFEIARNRDCAWFLQGKEILNFRFFANVIILNHRYHDILSITTRNKVPITT